MAPLSSRTAQARCVVDCLYMATNVKMTMKTKAVDLSRLEIEAKGENFDLSESRSI